MRWCIVAWVNRPFSRSFRSPLIDQRFLIAACLGGEYSLRREGPRFHAAGVKMQLSPKNTFPAHPAFLRGR